jgi:hypothetical protein
MSSPFEVKPYKKVEGIHEEQLTKWERFCRAIGKFCAEGISGKWKIEFKIKF